MQAVQQDEIEEKLKQAGLELMRIEHYKETDKNPTGRSEVELILSISRKA
jgi:hypothetical protein